MSTTRSPFRTSWCLTTLFAAQARWLGLDQSDLVRKTGLHKEIVRRALGKNPNLRGHVPSASTALIVAQALRLDVDFVGRLRERDELVLALAELRRNEKAERGRLGASVIERRIVDLNGELKALRPMTGACWPLASAFVRQRARRGITSESLAERLTADPAAQKRFKRELVLYEAGGLPVNDETLAAWLRAIAPPELDPEGLREQARADAEYTLVRADAWDRAALPTDVQIHDKRSIPGADLIYRRVTLPLPSIVAESIEATYAEPPAPRRGVRLIGASHRGHEVGLVTAGAVLLTVKRTPFAPEAPDEIPSFERGVDGVLAHDELLPGDVVFFNSGRYHRAEFLGPGKVVVINLRYTAVRTTI